MARRILDPRVRLHRRLRDRERADRGHGYFPGQGRVRRDRHRHPQRAPGTWARANTTRRSCSAVPKSITIIRLSPSSSPRPSSRPARPQSSSRSTTKSQGIVRSGGRAERRQDGSRKRRRQAGNIGRRFLWSLRCRTCATRRDVHHTRSGPRDDGAACLDRGMGRRQAHFVDVQPDDRLDDRGRREDARSSEGKRPPAFALHRRRLRRQAVFARRRRSRRLGRPRRGPAGESGIATAPDVQQHNPSAGHDPADPDRRRPRRQDHRDRDTKAGPATCRTAGRRRRSSRRACSTREQTG